TGKLSAITGMCARSIGISVRNQSEHPSVNPESARMVAGSDRTGLKAARLAWPRNDSAFLMTLQGGASGGVSSWCPRRHSLSEGRCPASDSNVTCWMLPNSFVHDAQRALDVIRCADHVGAICQEQLDFKLAQSAIVHGKSIEPAKFA